MRFSDEEVAAAIRKVVAEAGSDYVYPPAAAGEPCRYSDGYGGCVVGRAIRLLDPEIELVEDTAVSGQHLALHDVISGEAEEALQRAQNRQDEGWPWGEALEVFEEVLAR